MKMHIAYISIFYMTYICFKTREIDHVLTHDICTLYVYDMYIITHTPENAPTHICTFLLTHQKSKSTVKERLIHKSTVKERQINGKNNKIMPTFMRKYQHLFTKFISSWTFTNEKTHPKLSTEFIPWR